MLQRFHGRAAPRGQRAAARPPAVGRPDRGGQAHAAAGGKRPARCGRGAHRARGLEAQRRARWRPSFRPACATIPACSSTGCAGAGAKSWTTTPSRCSSSAPSDPDHATQWAAEREFVARRALPTTSPTWPCAWPSITKPPAGPAFAELEFLSGWIALRFLNKPEIAYDHFVRLYNEMKLPISLSRGAYWAGRAAEAMGKKRSRRQMVRQRRRQGDDLLRPARRRGASAPRPPRFSTSPSRGREETAAFEQRELVRVTRDLGEVGADETVRPFVRRLTETASTPVGLRAGRRGWRSISAVPIWPWPRPSAPAMPGSTSSPKAIRSPICRQTKKPDTVETPLLLAMTRQESAFDRAAVSHAGARGLDAAHAQDREPGRQAAAHSLFEEAADHRQALQRDARPGLYRRVARAISPAPTCWRSPPTTPARRG